jgi:predicted nuclease of predicted toxin-antitoxin system
VTSSNRPVFFIDWCLGKTVAYALREVGAQVEHHSNHFDQNAPDTEWLLVAGDRGWVVLTKDQAIGSNGLELRAIASANVKVFSLASGNLTRQQMADLFVAVLEKLERFTQGNQAPFIAKIYKDGRVRLWRNQTQLLKLLKGNDLLP